MNNSNIRISLRTCDAQKPKSIRSEKIYKKENKKNQSLVSGITVHSSIVAHGHFVEHCRVRNKAVATAVVELR